MISEADTYEQAQVAIELQTLVSFKMYIVPLKWLDIRDICLLFLVLSALIVFIMHELNHRKNLLQKCTVIQYFCTALVIFEVIYNIVM